MKRFANLSLLILLIAFVFDQAKAETEDFVFTYDYEGAQLDLFGIQRCVQIDAAMRINNPAFEGFEIVGVSIDIPSKEGCSCDPTGAAWLTKTLQVDGEYNLPDIQQVKGEIKNYGTEAEPQLRLDLTFPEPYILGSDGVYIGYSLTVTNCNVPGSGWTSKYPIVTVCDIDQPESLMIHCTKGESTLPQKYPEWTDLSEERHQALAMRVIMRGNRKENAAAFVPLQTLYVAPGSSGPVYVNLINNGTSPISYIEYSYTSGAGESASTYTKELSLDAPIPGQTGAFTTLDLSFEAPDREGKYSLPLRIDKVNGKPNEYIGTSALQMEVVPFLPEHSPLIEDYTGFWCGYCPAVYVTLHQMRDKYGEELLSIAYHFLDNLQCVPASKMPSEDTGLPKVYIEDRKENISYSNIESIWLRKRRELAPADINVEIYWDDEDHTALRAVSEVKFVYDQKDAQYRVAYAMIEDDMSDPDWSQANEYTAADIAGPYWDLFCGQPYRVKGIIYDDVVINFAEPQGIPGSLPAEILGGEKYRHESVIKLKDAVCQYNAISNYGENVIQNADKIRVVALLIDGNTGNVCNASTTGYSSDAGYSGAVDMLSFTDSEREESILSTDIYGFDGMKLNSIPQTGGYIVVYRMADGSISAKKNVR